MLQIRDKKGDGAFHIQYGPLAAAIRLHPDQHPRLEALQVARSPPEVWTS